MSAPMVHRSDDHRLDSLICDLVEWIARQPRSYEEVMEAWRTSCPRLTVWEEATDRGFVVREARAGGIMVDVTDAGRDFVHDMRGARPRTAGAPQGCR